MTKNQVFGLAIIVSCAAWFINEHKKEQMRMLYGVDSFGERIQYDAMRPEGTTQQ